MEVNNPEDLNREWHRFRYLNHEYGLYWVCFYTQILSICAFQTTNLTLFGCPKRQSAAKTVVTYAPYIFKDAAENVQLDLVRSEEPTDG